MAESSPRTVYAGMVTAAAVWWVGKAIATAFSKRVVENEPWPLELQNTRWVDLTALQLTVGVIVAGIWLKLSKKAVLPEIAWQLRWQVCVPVLGHVVGNLATNALICSSSKVQVVNSCQPFFTLLLSVFLSRVAGSFNGSTYLSVAIVVAGAARFAIGYDATLSLWGLLVGLISNIAFPLRNIFLNNLSDKWDDHVQKFAVMSIIGVILVLPLVAVKLVFVGALPTVDLVNGLVSSVFHSSYSIASLQVLESFNPVTHALLGLAQRVCVGLAGILLSGFPLTVSILVSLAVFLLGFYFYYTFKTVRFIPLKCLVLFGFLLFSFTSYSTMDRTSSMLHRTSQHCYTRISTSWVFDREMPPEVVTNIHSLAEKWDTTVDVYCGTTQCMEGVEGLDKVNIRAKFLVIPDILEGTPLRKWMGHHAINKVLAGKQFESHLHDVVKIGLLNKYGGVYIDPQVPVENLPCVPGKNSWVSEVSVDDAVRFLDMAHFPEQDPFLHKLADLYATKYPTKGKAVGFNFQQILEDNLGCYDCPKTIPTPLVKMIKTAITASKMRHYGTLSYDHLIDFTETNIGDEVQGFSGMQFLPFVDTFLQRDRLNVTSGGYNVTAFFNAWWGFSSAHWPPANNIHPIMLSIHIGAKMEGNWKKHLSYLEDKSIGCRDYSTLEFLQKSGVNSFFSGCMTLQTKRPDVHAERTSTIYIVDVDKHVLDLFPKQIRDDAVYLTHAYYSKKGDPLDLYDRFQKAYEKIMKYGTAKLVITQRVHCALPSVNMGTPVIFINHPGLLGASTKKASSRTTGLTPLFHTLDLFSLSIEDAKQWLLDFPWDNPPPNPRFELMMRLKATQWNVIRQHPTLYDSARKFGLLPLTQFPESQKPEGLVFHVVITREGSWGLNWRHWRCIESIFHHHPGAKVTVHSNMVSQEEFAVLTEAGYQVKVQQYSFKRLLMSSPVKAYAENLLQAKTNRNWKNFERDFLSLLVLHGNGGISMSVEVVLLRPVDTLQVNTIGFQKRTGFSTNFMIFEKDSLFLQDCLVTFANNYDASSTGTVGGLLKKSVPDGARLHLLPYTAFSLFHGHPLQAVCLEDTSGHDFDSNLEILTTKAYGVEINFTSTSKFGSKTKLPFSTLCQSILNTYCVLCNMVY